MQDFSQRGEQKIILDYFQPHLGRYMDFGTFLDLGANDGFTLSNSRALALLGWKGVCVEPAPIAFGKLAALYGPANSEWTSMVRTVNAAITTEDGPIDFYDSGTHLNKGDTSLLSTTRPEEMDRWKESGEVFTKTVVRGITFATLLKECGYGPLVQPRVGMQMPVARFDFISIDCEGVDLAILRQIDLTAIGCQLLCVEFNQKQAQEFIAYAEGHGMRLIFRNYENLIFGRQP